MASAFTLGMQLCHWGVTWAPRCPQAICWNGGGREQLQGSGQYAPALEGTSGSPATSTSTVHQLVASQPRFQQNQPCLPSKDGQHQQSRRHVCFISPSQPEIYIVYTVYELGPVPNSSPLSPLVTLAHISKHRTPCRFTLVCLLRHMQFVSVLCL